MQEGVNEYERQDSGEGDYLDWKVEMRALGARVLP